MKEELYALGIKGDVLLEVKANGRFLYCQSVQVFASPVVPYLIVRYLCLICQSELGVEFPIACNLFALIIAKLKVNYVICIQYGVINLYVQCLRNFLLSIFPFPC